MIHILDFYIDEGSLKLSYHKMMTKRIFKVIKNFDAFSKYKLMNFQHFYSKKLGYFSWSDLVYHCQGVF